MSMFFARVPPSKPNEPSEVPPMSANWDQNYLGEIKRRLAHGWPPQVIVWVKHVLKSTTRYNFEVKCVALPNLEQVDAVRSPYASDSALTKGEVKRFFDARFRKIFVADTQLSNLYKQTDQRKKSSDPSQLGGADRKVTFAFVIPCHTIIATKFQ